MWYFYSAKHNITKQGMVERIIIYGKKVTLIKFLCCLPECGGQRQADLDEFEISLVFIVDSKPATVA